MKSISVALGDDAAIIGTPWRKMGEQFRPGTERIILEIIGFDVLTTLSREGLESWMPKIIFAAEQAVRVTMEQVSTVDGLKGKLLQRNGIPVMESPMVRLKVDTINVREMNGG